MPQGAERTQPIGAAPGLPARLMEARPLTGVSRRFGDLRVRPKLMVLHNSFFLLLACAVYFTVIDVVEGRLQQAQQREMTLILNAFSALSPETGDEMALRPYDLRQGTAAEFGLPEEAVRWMERFPGRIWRSPGEHIYKLIPGTARYYRLTLPVRFYESVVAGVQVALFAALGVLYVLAVLLLELVILPRYVYQPLRLLLEADAATRRGDRQAEIIGEQFIPGDEIGMILRSHNDTVRALRRREDELEQARRNLEAQDRLVSLGILSASVAHEMNTPLAVLHGSIEKMLEKPCDAATRSRLERMIRVTDRLRKISASLLDFARLRRETMEPVDLRPLVEEAWQLVGIDEKAGEVAFRLDVPEGVRVCGNSGRLVQVFVNLLRNALMAAPAGSGEIAVRTEAAVLDGKRAVRITVEDNGPGIPPEILPEVFDAFVSDRLDAQGTGLGLTVAQGIVSQHGGTIRAYNRETGGAALEVVLPAPEGEPRA
ncbi:MAG: ATP-binding protein [Bryobacteraceae bacterium]